MSILEWVIGGLLLLGALFVLLGSVALLKLPDFYTRLHGPTKATTLGLGSLVLASLLCRRIDDATPKAAALTPRSS